MNWKKITGNEENQYKKKRKRDEWEDKEDEESD